ncbi:uncharacterized protein LOC109601471 [Aethina tumida]|uniref:uncharacterized protein LOC109601471 n=1 Tax=Aethina tumida TaxID=116153 RepID=UPI002148A83F|nr:uncharacterized protein LOC109601471 [Aethina tumida]
MKSLTCLVLTVLVCTVWAVPFEVLDAQLTNAKHVCLNQTKLDQKLALGEKLSPRAYEVKVFMSCLLVQLRIQDEKSGKINEDEFRKFLTDDAPVTDEQAKCLKQKGSPTETAFHLFKCMNFIVDDD